MTKSMDCCISFVLPALMLARVESLFYDLWREVGVSYRGSVASGPRTLKNKYHTRRHKHWSNLRLSPFSVSQTLPSLN